MAFALDDDRRIHDPQRNLTLVFRGSEKEGAHEFALTGSDVQVGFIGRNNVARIEGADPRLPAPLRTLVTWRIALWNGAIPSGWTRVETERVIAEAMAVWRYGHGGPEQQLVEVQFA